MLAAVPFQTRPGSAGGDQPIVVGLKVAICPCRLLVPSMVSLTWPVDNFRWPSASKPTHPPDSDATKWCDGSECKLSGYAFPQFAANLANRTAE